jgi:hypothetical protein
VVDVASGADDDRFHAKEMILDDAAVASAGYHHQPLR